MFDPLIWPFIRLIFRLKILWFWVRQIYNCHFLLLAVSLARFPLILFSHHSVRVLGVTKYLHPHAHGRNNRELGYFVKTISGLPGNFLSCSLYLNPYICKSFLTTNSGFVFLLFAQLMLKLRCSGIWTSAIDIYAFMIWYSGYNCSSKKKGVNTVIRICNTL